MIVPSRGATCVVVARGTVCFVVEPLLNVPQHARTAERSSAEGGQGRAQLGRARARPTVSTSRTGAFLPPRPCASWRARPATSSPSQPIDRAERAPAAVYRLGPGRRRGAIEGPRPARSLPRSQIVLSARTTDRTSRPATMRVATAQRGGGRRGPDAYSSESPCLRGRGGAKRAAH